MKTPIRAYATALYEMSLGHSKIEVKEITDRFLDELKAKRLGSGLGELMVDLDMIDDQTEGIVRATVTSAHALAKNILNDITLLIKKKTGAESVIFEELIDPTVLGGVIIRYNDTVLDLSARERIAAMAEEIKK